MKAATKFAPSSLAVSGGADLVAPVLTSRPIRTLRECASWFALAAFVFGAGVVCSAIDAVELRKRRWSEATDDDALLRAIRQVESGDRWSAVGSHGERGAYQFTPWTWSRFTREPFYLATFNRGLAEKVARAFLASLRADCAKRGEVATAYLLAKRWRGERSTGRSDYASRVSNLYLEATL